VEAHGGSSVVLAPQVTAQGGSIGGDGSVRVNGTLDVVGTVRKNGSGALRANGPLMLPEGGTIDVLGGSAIIDYAAASPFGELRSKIISGFNGRAWNGSGIRSSTAAGGPRLALGYAEASALFNSFPATFAGETIDSTTVLVRLTRFGDADLSGRVDLADFNRLATHFNDPGFWTDGDFNYDGQVNLIDFNLLAANFNQSAGPDGVVDPEDWANLASAVPEPGAVGVSVAPILAARRRRRK
jgi:hypothetical protein